MALDRGKFRATSVAATIQKDAKLNESLGRDGGFRTEYLKFEQGANLIRIYPPHPEEDGGGVVFAEPKVTVFLPMMVVQKNDRGEELIDSRTKRPITKESVKSVFNSRIHGGTPKDLVEEYISFAQYELTEELKTCQDPKAKQFTSDKLEAITGNFKKKVQGLRYKQAWVMYADKITAGVPKFGILEIGPAIKDRLNSIAASTDTSGDPLATDPFTDIETGRAIVVTYNKDALQPKDYYKTELDNVMEPTIIGGQRYMLPRMFPLSDEQLESFLKVTPLAKRFTNCFKRRDFNLQLEGLMFFDEKFNIGLFQNPKWLSVCEEIEAYYPEDDQVEEEPEVMDVSAKVTQEEPDGDQYDLMNRKELAAFAKINSTGLLIKPTMSDDDVRNALRAWEEAQSISAEDMAEDVTEDMAESAQVEESEPTKTTIQTTAASSIDRLRKLREQAKSSN